jgi:RNA polymerase sigma factor (sigma-70 family)
LSEIHRRARPVTGLFPQPNARPPMATPGLAGFFTRVRSTLTADDRSDAELVRTFAGSRSEPAFAELVRRFAPMVWGVCRRTVGHHQSAEDAFQAVFLVLTRKAWAIRPPTAVGGWLHAVAVHTSLRARAMSDRKRKRHTALNPDHAAQDVTAADPDAVRALDEEVARLPDRLRTAVVLCELDGVSRREAATRLGVAEGTLSSRLAAARKALASRLRGRGITLGAGGIAAFVGGGMASAAPPVTSSASETVSALAEGAIRTMFLSKLKLLTAGALAVAVLVTASVFAVSPAVAAEPRNARRNAPVPKAEREGVILVGVQEDGKNRIDLLTPKGEKVVTIPLDPHPMYHPALSRDGKRVAVWQWDALRIDQANRGAPGQKISNEGTLLVFDVTRPDEPLLKVEKVRSGGSVFAPDGNSLYMNDLSEPDPAKGFRESTLYRLDLKTGKKEKLDLPADHHVTDVSPDGKTLLTVSFKPRVKGEFHTATHLVPLATLKPELVSKACVGCNRFSPDGNRVIGRKTIDPKNAWKMELVVLDVNDGKESAVKLEDDTEIVWNAAWSPDARKLLVHRQVLLAGEKASVPAPAGAPPGALVEGPRTRHEVAIRNPNGSAPKPLVETKRETHIFGIDWR